MISVKTRILVSVGVSVFLMVFFILWLPHIKGATEAALPYVLLTPVLNILAGFGVYAFLGILFKTNILIVIIVCLFFIVGVLLFQILALRSTLP